jgi:hypothetical protein
MPAAGVTRHTGRVGAVWEQEEDDRVHPPPFDPAALLADVLAGLQAVRDQLQRIEVRLALLPLPGPPGERRDGLPPPS